jgi:LmbE family N-acetylglucosaminyl deacetylase
MSITSTIIKVAAPVPRIEDYDRFLFIGPHPDDIEVGAGATAAKLAANGKKVCFLICTDGRYGDEYAPEGVEGDALAELRKQEAITSANHLGIECIRFLDLSDGGFYTEEALFTGIARVVGEFKPDVIFTVDPDVKSECHIDHLNTGRASKRIAYFAPFKKIMANYGADTAPVKAIAFYMTASPNRFVKTKGFFKKQLEALFTCFPSQYPKENPASASVALYLKLRAHEYGLRHFCSTADGFRVLGTTHMHCLPESGK